MLTEAIRLFVTLALTVSASNIAQKIHIPYVSKNIAIILFIIIGTGLGYVIGGITGRRITWLVEWIDEKTSKISSQQLMSGIAGIVIGLVIAALIAKPVEDTLRPLTIGGPYAMTLIYLILGYLGFTIFINRRLDLGFSNAAAQNPTATANIIDTSVIIDGRITDVAKSGFIQGSLIIPRFVVSELQMLADSSDDLRRAKGRRGLDILQQLKKEGNVNVLLVDDDYPSIAEVDYKLVKLAKDKNANLITNDYNLGKVALLEGLHVMNINDLAKSLKPIIMPGEDFSVSIVKEGKEKDQGIAYLEDGTMIVVQQGRAYIGKTIPVNVTSVLQTSAGKLIFAAPKKKET